ncbi:MAG: hypothetical protein ACSW8K_10960, partial [bacterium]
MPWPEVDGAAGPGIHIFEVRQFPLWGSRNLSKIYYSKNPQCCSIILLIFVKLFYKTASSSRFPVSSALVFIQAAGPFDGAAPSKV